jgi:hypothetical protein
VSETGDRRPGQPESAADLAARFRQHKLGQKLLEDVRTQAHWKLNPYIARAMELHHRKSVVGATEGDDADWSATDLFSNRQRR